MGSPWEIDPIHIVIRLLLALVLGGAIGWERELSNRAAGLRTNILVCVGSALIMLLSMYGFSAFSDEPNVRLDPARLAAQVISGIGFLGAGVILFNGFSVTGLTTAATLWVVAGIGLAVGAGFYFPTILTTVIVLFSLLVLNKVEHRWFRIKNSHVVRLKMEDRPGAIGKISNLLQQRQMDLKRVQIHPEGDQSWVSFSVKANNKEILSLLDDLRLLPEVFEVIME